MQKNKECKNLDMKKYEVIFVDVELKENERIDDLEFKGLKNNPK